MKRKIGKCTDFTSIPRRIGITELRWGKEKWINYISRVNNFGTCSVRLRVIRGKKRTRGKLPHFYSINCRMRIMVSPYYRRCRISGLFVRRGKFSAGEITGIHIYVYIRIYKLHKHKKSRNSPLLSQSAPRHAHGISNRCEKVGQLYIKLLRSVVVVVVQSVGRGFWGINFRDAS